MAKDKADKPLADWETEKIKRARKGAADLGVRAAEVGDVFKPDPKTVGEASMFSTMADKVAGYFKAQADHARGGKKRGESHAKRDHQIRGWAAEWRDADPDISESSIAREIKNRHIRNLLRRLEREANERAEEAYARWEKDVAEPQLLEGGKRRAHKQALEDDAAAITKRNRNFWDLSERRILEIISPK